MEGALQGKGKDPFLPGKDREAPSLLTPSCALQIDQMFTAFPPDVTGNLDYKNLVHIITHGEEKD